MVREIEADAKQFADPRRTLIQADKRVAPKALAVPDEAVTVIVSEQGWVRTRGGHGLDPMTFAFKPGDALYGAFEARSTGTLLAFGSNGRIYTVPIASLPSGRGDGQPVTTLVELESGTRLLHYFAGPPAATLLLSGSGGYGFLATVEQMTSRQRAGKAFLSLGDGESPCAPSLVSGAAGALLGAGQPAPPVPAATHVACASGERRILTFAIDELRTMPTGGRGLLLIDLEAGDVLAGAAAYRRSVRVSGVGRAARAREETLEIRSLNNARGVRGRKGRPADLGFRPIGIVRVE